MTLAPKKNPTWIELALCSAVLFAAAWLYAPVIELDYVWDDSQLFADNAALRSGDMEWAKVVRPALPSSSYIRPVVLWSYMAEFRYLGLSPVYSHTISYLTYLANVALVMLLASQHFVVKGLSVSGRRAALAGLIYAVHPALVESTAWASGRFDLFVTFFVLLALIADLRISRPILKAAATSVAFGLALGSKETAVALPVLLILQRLSLQGTAAPLLVQTLRLIRDHSHTVWMCALVAGVYVLIRLGAAPSRLAPPTSVGEALPSVAAHIVYIFRTIAFYFEQGLAPLLGTSMPIHPAEPGRIFHVDELLRATGGAAGLALVLWGVVRRFYWGWMILAALIVLLPVLNIIILGLAGNIGCDRFMTLPLVFVAMGIAGSEIAIPGLRKSLGDAAVALALGLWATAAFANVRVTIPLWKNNVTLWTWMYEQPNPSNDVWVNYSSALLSERQYEKARRAFEERLHKGPLEATPQMSYGFLLAMTGEPEEGIQYIKGALSVFPPVEPLNASDAEKLDGDVALLLDRVGFGHYALAEAYLISGKPETALEYIERAVAYKPLVAQNFMIRSFALAEIGRAAESEASFKKAMDLAHPASQKGLLLRREEFHRDFAGRASRASQMSGAAAADGDAAPTQHSAGP